MAAKSSDWQPGPTVCRCCLTEGCYKDISTEYFWMGKREVYSEMLSETFDVTISYALSMGTNSNSRLICEPCISRLRDASDFKRQVLDCERTFLQYLVPQSSSAGEGTTATDQDIKVSSVKLEVKFSDDEEIDTSAPFQDDDDDLDDEPLTKLASKIPKKESVDYMELEDNAKPVKRKSTIKIKASPSKKAKKTKETVKATASKAAATAKPEKKKKGSDATEIASAKTSQPKRIVPLFQVAYDRSLCRPLGTIKDFSSSGILRNSSKCSTERETFTPPRSVSPDYVEATIPECKDLNPPVEVLRPKVPKKNVDSRTNALIVFEFSTVYPFIYGNNKFKCFICSQPFLEMSVLRQHMNENHNFAPLKRLINNRGENILKVDVSHMACKICPFMPNDLSELKSHLKQEHNKAIQVDLQDNLIPFKLDGGDGSYKCVICNEVFLKVRILVIHMSVHFNNYSCEVCGSGFMTLRLLKKHLEVHENGNFPCDKCSKVFSTPQKRSLHNRCVHLKQNPRRCPMCPERFNSNYRRTIHLQDVHNVSTRVHKCETCGRAFNLKYHLICHTRSVHLQERNHQCDVCHQRFCNKETLKRHMIVHTGEKKYKCEVCGMAFLRRKNLKDHLRLHEIVQ